LKAGLSLAATALPPLSALATTGAAETVKLSDKVAVVSGVGCNVLALSSPDGLTLVDCGAAEHTSTLLKHLRELPGGKRVQSLFNTHWHPDQTGSNEVFGKTGAQIIAHQKSYLWLATDHWVPSEERYAKARPTAAHPTKIFYTSGSLSVGDEHVEYGYLIEAHTDGDAYVFCRNSNVLAVGHAASPVRDPELDWFGGGWIGGRLDALSLLIKLCNEQTKVVPAFGPVITRNELKAELDLLQQVYDRSVNYLRKAFAYEDMLEAGVLQGLPRTWADEKTFMYSVCKGLWAHHNMLTHDIV
jgi:glyoxylase-like metal-dependent hydrolase (beta-lactamase superfamily II)